MKLKDLAGEHMLDAVDFWNEQRKTWCEQLEDCQAMRFRLDGKVYVAVEDPEDNFRSHMKNLFVSEDAAIKNVFEPVRVIGLVEIANTGTGTAEVGNYAVVLKKTPPFAGALRAAWKRGLLKGEDDDAIAAGVEGHHRTQRGSYDLLYRALKACGLDRRNP